MFFVFVATIAMWQMMANAWISACFKCFSRSNMTLLKPPEAYIAEINAIWENDMPLEMQEIACFRIIENVPKMPKELRAQAQEFLVFVAGQGYLKNAWKHCTATCGRAYL